MAIGRADTVPRGLMFARGHRHQPVVLYSAAVLLSEGARRLVRLSWPYVLRQGIANLYRPANQTRSVVIALGFGSFPVTTLYPQANLVRQFDITAAASKGNLVMFDIRDDQRAGVEQAIGDGRHPLISMTPIVTMRIAGSTATTSPNTRATGSRAATGRCDASTAPPTATQWWSPRSWWRASGWERTPQPTPCTRCRSTATSAPTS